MLNNIEIPKTMKGIELKEFGTPVFSNTIPVPQLEEGQLLIKVEMAPINPSDSIFIQGLYTTEVYVPCIPGFEGSGTVVAAKGKLETTYIGKRVGFITLTCGSYAQYAIAQVAGVVVLPEEINFEQGCLSVVNPFTVVSMLKIAKRNQVKAIINTAAASQLGQQMVKYFQQHGVEVIGVVRKKEQAELLQKLGAKYVVNSSEEGYLDTLKQYASKLDARIAFDAISGEMTGKILSSMPPLSTIYVYGDFSGQPSSGLTIGDLVFQGKKVAGFLLDTELQMIPLEEIQEMAEDVGKQLSSVFHTDVDKVFSCEEFKQGFDYSKNNSQKGKILIKMN